MAFKKEYFALFFLVLIALLLVLSGCGGGGDEEETKKITEEVKAQVEKIKKEQKALSPDELSKENIATQLEMGNETNYHPIIGEFTINYGEHPPKFMWEVVDKNVGDKHSGIIYIAHYEYSLVEEREGYKKYGGKLSNYEALFGTFEDTGEPVRIDVDKEESKEFYLKQYIEGQPAGVNIAVYMAELKVTDGINSTEKVIGPFVVTEKQSGVEAGSFPAPTVKVVEEYEGDPGIVEIKEMKKD